MTRGGRCAVLVLTLVLEASGLGTSTQAPESSPLDPAESRRMAEALEKRIAQLDQEIEAAGAHEPRLVQLLFARGQARFLHGDFAESVADFDRELSLAPQRKSQHWQRGIALYYNEEYRRSAQQFEDYHSFDAVDRENGIWRFLAQAQSSGIEAARKELLRYEKDDREPFPDLYAMFAGTITREEVLTRIERAELDDDARAKRLFYAHLYAGLYSDVQGDGATARNHLTAAVANRWGRVAAGGPGYMWHVARLHLARIER